MLRSLSRVSSLHKASISRTTSSYRQTSRNLNISAPGPGVRILEVGPRDGLQNIKATVPTAVKVELIQRLAEAGLKNIEATSFVSPKWVPQLADGADVMGQVLPLGVREGISMPVLAPNMKGLQNAVKSGARDVVVFASATEAFSRKNQNCSVDEALDEAERVTIAALEQGLRVRGVISCIFSDPYSGTTAPEEVLRVAQSFLAMGCYEVGLGDTLGVGTPVATMRLLEVLLQYIPTEKLAGHFHDTYGQAVANVVAAYSMGIRAFDSSVAGLGGCPYAPGAKGNLATEDIIYTFDNSGIPTGVDLQKLALTGDWISRQLGIPNSSRAGAAIAAKSRAAEAPAAKAIGKAEKVAPRTWKQIDDQGEFKVERAGSAVKITLTRPQKGNSMTTTMLQGVTRTFQQLAKDQTVFHIVLAAEGKFFCTGMDLSSGTDRTNKSEANYYQMVRDLFTAVDTAPQTTIAVIEGPCFGGGVGLGFACDVRIVSKKAKWTLTEIKLGLSPAIISIYMAREWGLPFFREAMLAGREVSPEELQRIGAVHQIAEDSENMSNRVDGYLDRLDRCAPQSAATCKELVRLAWTDPAGQKQNEFIERTFDRMMAPGSEGEHGIKQFQQKIRNIDWSAFWGAAKARL